MRKRRLILTNVNRSVFKPRFCQTFLSELVVNCLLHEEVLIREGDLIGNRRLTAYLSDESALQIFSELLSVGAVRILRLGSKSYPSNVTRNPRSFPISARAEDQQLNRSDAGKPWKVTDWEWRLFSRMDDVLTKSSESYKWQHSFPKENRFAAEFSELLTHRGEFRLNERIGFKDISPEMADMFIEFCHKPEVWIRFLEDNGIKAIEARQDGFYRTQAYQCSFLFEPRARRAMQRLIESTYAACECDRESADGCYGRSGLAELPARCVDYDGAYDEVSRFEVIPVVPKKSGLRLAIGPGIGDVVAEVRSGIAFNRFQEYLANAGSIRSVNGDYRDPYRTFADMWTAVCSDYEEAWARHMIHQGSFDGALGSLFLAIYVLARTLGFVAIGVRYDLAGQVLHGDVMHMLDHYYLVPRMENWFPALSRRIRGISKMPSARAEMVNAATLRHTRVELYTQSK